MKTLASSMSFHMCWWTGSVRFSKRTTGNSGCACQFVWQKGQWLSGGGAMWANWFGTTPFCYSNLFCSLKERKESTHFQGNFSWNNSSFLTKSTSQPDLPVIPFQNPTLPEPWHMWKGTLAALWIQLCFIKNYFNDAL